MKPARERSVFINCPFDDAFVSTFDAIVFTVVCCGFHPRCALETGTTADPRVDRMLVPLSQSKYSIHDLTRFSGEGPQNLARFNMPLELGIAMEKRFRPDGPTPHDWLLLVPHVADYRRFVSDLAAYDPLDYDQTPQGVVQAVTSWLTTRVDCPPARASMTPRRILDVLPQFQLAVEAMRAEWPKGPAPWQNLVQVAQKASRQRA